MDVGGRATPAGCCSTITVCILEQGTGPVMLTGTAEAVAAKRALLSADACVGACCCVPVGHVAVCQWACVLVCPTPKAHRDLAALYKSLVDPPEPSDRLLSEPQFWETRQALLKEAMGREKRAQAAQQTGVCACVGVHARQWFDWLPHSMPCQTTAHSTLHVGA